MSGRFTTVEGLLVATKEKLEEQSPFFVGDSAPSSERETYERLIKKLDSIILLKTPATLILDDPAGNSYLMVGLFIHYVIRFKNVSEPNRTT